MKFLDWFVDEQMEEEDNADSMINRYKLFGSDPRVCTHSIRSTRAEFTPRRASFSDKRLSDKDKICRSRIQID